MSTHYPNGSVQGLCSAATIVFVLGVSFLGFLAYQFEGPWAGVDLAIAICLLAGSVASAFTPFMATSPREDAIKWARRTFLAGALFVLIAVVLAFALSVLLPNDDSHPQIRESSQRRDA
jgi:membrane-bound metal-dependent hydrolase YbcI (DUF457 family)